MPNPETTNQVAAGVSLGRDVAPSTQVLPAPHATRFPDLPEAVVTRFPDLPESLDTRFPDLSVAPISGSERRVLHPGPVRLLELRDVGAQRRAIRILHFPRLPLM